MVDNLIKGIQEREWKISFPILKFCKWLKKRKNPAKVSYHESSVWCYDGCDCVAAENGRSIPYCEKHYNPLIFKEIWIDK